MAPSMLRRRIVLATLGSPLLFHARGALALTECKVAAPSLLGPAYRADAPFRSALCAKTEPGTALKLAGRVVSQDSCKPLAGAVIDVWQVNDAGDYDMDSKEFRMRGRLRTASNGKYEIATIVPGAYGRRAKHIHFLVSSPGHEPRITQCYFEGDERVKQDSLVKPSLVIALRGQGKGKHGSFDIGLEPERPADDAAVKQYPDYAGKYELAPGLFLTFAAEGRQLRWTLSAPENPGDPLTGVLLARSANRFYCPEYDGTVTFVRDDHGKVTHFLQDDRDLVRKVS